MQEPATGPSCQSAKCTHEANILPGKRQRKAVNYCKLNDALFGELTTKEKASHLRRKKKMMNVHKSVRKRVIWTLLTNAASASDNAESSSSSPVTRIRKVTRTKTATMIVEARIIRQRTPVAKVVRTLVLQLLAIGFF
jgi:hypothetical protein